MPIDMFFEDIQPGIQISWQDLDSLEKIQGTIIHKDLKTIEVWIRWPGSYTHRKEAKTVKYSYGQLASAFDTFELCLDKDGFPKCYHPSDWDIARYMGWDTTSFEIARLKSLHTRELLKQLRYAHAHGDGYTDYPYETLKAELALREHIPNKPEAKALRRQKAQMGKKGRKDK